MEGETRPKYLNLGVPLYQAALKGDWIAAKDLINNNSDAVRVSTTERGETALHVAAAAKRTSFVKELVDRMEERDLALQNKYGYSCENC
ncbi:hypothetical protein F0562_029708 [Nyssa sinensis]|uniref:Uncharacterized protein n=1 Tax=Nyssa sinensis TaxID=561372 RepID=A0A5J5B4S6_9ASTE|nr:hypothetical protein F0562_029708 [Nyssa sinensis]